MYPVGHFIMSPTMHSPDIGLSSWNDSNSRRIILNVYGSGKRNKSTNSKTINRTSESRRLRDASCGLRYRATRRRAMRNISQQVAYTDGVMAVTAESWIEFWIVKSLKTEDDDDYVMWTSRSTGPRR